VDKKADELSNKGFEYLLFYFANLHGGKSVEKLTFKERIQWSKDNVMNIYQTFINNIDLFFKEILPNLKEPFQFISIMFATIKYLNAT
jgi:DNA-directed RNA polymerase